MIQKVLEEVGRLPDRLLQTVEPGTQHLGLVLSHFLLQTSQ